MPILYTDLSLYLPVPRHKDRNTDKNGRVRGKVVKQLRCVHYKSNLLTNFFNVHNVRWREGALLCRQNCYASFQDHP